MLLHARHPGQCADDGRQGYAVLDFFLDPRSFCPFPLVGAGDTLNAETTRLLEQVGALRLSMAFTATEVQRVVQQTLQVL